MLVLAKDKKVWWPVKVRIPVDGGKYQEQEFEAQFRIIGQSEVEGFAPAQANRRTIEEALVDTRGIRADADANSQDLPFDADLKAALLEQPHILGGLTSAYIEAIAGRRSKN